MRALVVLAAIVFKVWFVARIMTPEERKAFLSRIAFFLFLAVLLTFMGGCDDKVRHEPVEQYCNYEPQRPEDWPPECQYKLCNAFGALSPREG